jgi:cell division protein FtsL
MEAALKRRRRFLAALPWLVILPASLSVVTWRQTEGVARERAIRETRAERAITETERMELERRIQALSTRTRVVRVARERLGMAVPSDDEIVLLPLSADTVAAFTSDEGRP